MASTIAVSFTELSALRTRHEELANRMKELENTAGSAMLHPAPGLLLGAIAPLLDSMRTATQETLAAIADVEDHSAQQLASYESAMTAYEDETVQALRGLLHQVESVGSAHATGEQGLDLPPGEPVGGEHTNSSGHGFGPTTDLPSSPSHVPELPLDQELPFDQGPPVETAVPPEQIEQEAEAEFWADESADDPLGRSPEELQAAFENREGIDYQDLSAHGDLIYGSPPADTSAPAPTTITFR